MGHVYTSILAALKVLGAYLISTWKQFRVMLKLARYWTPIPSDTAASHDSDKDDPDRDACHRKKNRFCYMQSQIINYQSLTITPIQISVILNHG